MVLPSPGMEGRGLSISLLSLAAFPFAPLCYNPINGYADPDYG